MHSSKARYVLIVVNSNRSGARIRRIAGVSLSPIEADGVVKKDEIRENISAFWVPGSEITEVDSCCALLKVSQ
jgi:hypothetical protein